MIGVMLPGSPCSMADSKDKQEYDTASTLLYG